MTTAPLSPPSLSSLRRRLRGASPTGDDKTVLMVTPFAPYRDGISTYAQQELIGLRHDGLEVDVLSPTPSAAHYHLPLGGPRGAAELAAKAGDYDRVVVQFAPEFLFGRCRTSAERALVWGALTSITARSALELRLHEIIYEWLRQSPVERNAARLAFKAADRITVHTEVEKSALVSELGPVANRIEVIDHGARFVKRVDVGRAEAKNRLGLPHDEFALLCIGFLQFSKGFDRAVEAVAAAVRQTRQQPSKVGLPPLRLHVVGTGRVNSPEIETYISDLRTMCRHSSSAMLHERFVSDLEFDMWLAAADAVVLPYREIWSSGVIERARLYDAPIISSDLPQLIDQLPADGTACASVDQMATAVLQTVEARQAGSMPLPVFGEHEPLVEETSEWIVDIDQPDRQLIQKQIQIRAELQPDEPTQAKAAYRRPGLSTPAAELAALASVPRPEAASARPGVSHVKQAVQRLTSWQVDPIARHVDELQAVVVQTVLDLETQLRTSEPQVPDSFDHERQAADPSSLITGEDVHRQTDPSTTQEGNNSKPDVGSRPGGWQ